MIVKVLAPLVVTSLPILTKISIFDINYRTRLFKRDGQLVPLDSTVESSIEQVFNALSGLKARTESQWKREESYFQFNYTESDYPVASGSIWVHRCRLGLPFNVSFTHLNQAINFLEIKGFYLDWESTENLEIASKYLLSELERQFIIAQGVCKLLNKISLPIHVLANGIVSAFFVSCYQLSQPASIKLALVCFLVLGVLVIESIVDSINTSEALEEALALDDRYLDGAIDLYKKIEHRNELLETRSKKRFDFIESMRRNAENQVAREVLDLLIEEKTKRMNQTKTDST